MLSYAKPILSQIKLNYSNKPVCNELATISLILLARYARASAVLRANGDRLKVHALLEDGTAYQITIFHKYGYTFPV